MEKQVSRRNFLRNTVLSTFGISLFSASALGSGHLLNVADHEVLDLRESWFEMDYLLISGRIVDKSDLNPRSGVMVDVWQEDPQTGREIRSGSITVSDTGRYLFKTNMPASVNEDLPTIHFRLRTESHSYETKLLINEFGAYIDDKHWVLNNQLGEKLFPKRKKHLDHTALEFDLSI